MATNFCTTHRKYKTCRTYITYYILTIQHKNRINKLSTHLAQVEISDAGSSPAMGTYGHGRGMSLVEMILELIINVNWDGF